MSLQQDLVRTTTELTSKLQFLNKIVVEQKIMLIITKTWFVILYTIIKDLKYDQIIINSFMYFVW